MNHDQMRRRCPTAQYQGTLELRGWRLIFGSHANIEPYRGGRVPGALWSIGFEDFVALDVYEGWPSYYTRRRWRQDDRHFFFYEMAPDRCIGTPSPNYVKGIEQGYLDCGLDPDRLHDQIQRRQPGLTRNPRRHIITA